MKNRKNLNSKPERRRAPRLKIDRKVKIPVQIFPVLPFLGEPVPAGLVNISEGGMALDVDLGAEGKKKIRNGMKIKIHFHLPGMPLEECVGKIRRRSISNGRELLAIRFEKASKTFLARVEKMAQDNADCERRIQEMASPPCDLSCTYINLCRKPIRIFETEGNPNHFEIALQFAENS